MSLYQAIVLAVVQGLTEWLPISSTAHLILFPWLLGWADPGLAFDVALHTGTLLAVLAYFYRDWIELGRAALDCLSRSRSPQQRFQQQLLWYLILGSLPAAIVGLLARHAAETQLRTVPVISASLIGVGLLMGWAERHSSFQRDLSALTRADALHVGLAQALAVIPGVSRSGITITAGLGRGMNRHAAARFSFLLSTPAIAGAAIVELPKLVHALRVGSEPVSSLALVTAMGTSALVGYLAIATFLRYLQFRTLKPFVYYRIVLGFAILGLWFLQSAGAR